MRPAFAWESSGTKSYSKWSNMPRLVNVARHEAGHAVVAIHLGLVVQRVELCADGGGLTTIECPRSKDLQVAIAFAAGCAADRLGKCPTPEWQQSPDRKLAAEHGFGRREWPALEALARAYLRGPCKHAWLAVADALMLSDLDGHQLRRVVRRYR